MFDLCVMTGILDLLKQRRVDMKFICDANPKDSVEFQSDDSGLHIGITSEDGGYAEVYLSFRYAKELASFLVDSVGDSK
jgi:hypothetical protein